jgi:P27 family predicted phage terminase small subunit
MGARGPKPTPAKLLLLKGNKQAGKQATLEQEANAVDIRIPSAPSYVTGLALREWRRITRVLKQYGLITLLDRAAVAAYCISYQRWAEAEAVLQERGPAGMVQTYDSGAQAIDPMVSIANKYNSQMVGYLHEFGLTPSARRAVTISRQDDGDPDGGDTKPGEEEDPEDFFD